MLTADGSAVALVGDGGNDATVPGYWLRNLQVVKRPAASPRRPAPAPSRRSATPLRRTRACGATGRAARTPSPPAGKRPNGSWRSCPPYPLIARAARLFLIGAVHQLAAGHGVRPDRHHHQRPSRLLRHRPPGRVPAVRHRDPQPTIEVEAGPHVINHEVEHVQVGSAVLHDAAVCHGTAPRPDDAPPEARPGTDAADEYGLTAGPDWVVPDDRSPG